MRREKDRGENDESSEVDRGISRPLYRSRGTRSENTVPRILSPSASSLFIADTTLRAYIPPCFPRDSAPRARKSSASERVKAERKLAGGGTVDSSECLEHSEIIVEVRSRSGEREEIDFFPA